MTTVAKSKKLAQHYYRAVISGRPLATEARRAGVHPSTLWKHAQLWPEIPIERRKSCTLRPWERTKLDEILERMGYADQ